ncbi:MAG: glutathione S-transferase N-terminal domain-containing protein [Chloroflexi bacterium]|nr:glutathione S-transferase N-terminal domain-containing protein [Chloroflexota bacterium]
MAQVTVYSTLSCPWCKKAKQLLDTNRIAYTNLDVASDAAARKEMVQKSGQLGVPVIDIDGKIVVGYDEAEMKKLLHIQ